MFTFKTIKKSKNSRARLGIITTPHGKINTPNISIIGTKGAIRGISFKKARKFGAQIFMINTFHFFHNNRFKIVKKFGGLHKFLGVDYPLMTDSGGFQVFSLGFGKEQGVGKIASIFPEESKNSISGAKFKNKNLVKIYEDGVEFISPYNGDRMFLSPSKSIMIQKILGADIIFTFDECTSPLADYEYTKLAMKRTHRWAIKCLETFRKSKNQVLFGIVQGGQYEDLRKESAKFINSLPFFGFGIGGSLGKTKKDMIKVLDWTITNLDENKPRHLLGIGEVDDIFNAIEQGVDLFDCVIPTRWARHGTAFTYQGRLNLKKSKLLSDKKPIDPKCSCEVCKRYSRAYVCHLLKEKEIYGIMLLVEHNVFWILKLFKEIRRALREEKFEVLKRTIIRKYQT
ncbi:MAG: tRNA guanosine(34) transglycosylase Tgt [Patescibacteria group bacterium]|nr:tRNA guanosine(34) transglycosylase Tgt [Patescibacteria group bacterium]